MKSYNESAQSIEYKSGLELKALIFCDSNPKVLKYSVEPFAIQYVKPTDNKIHRYYPDMLICFKNDTFLVEIKSSGETMKPKPPKKLTPKGEKNYKRALMTYAINTAKWKEASKFADNKGIKFIFLTEKQLG